MDGGGNQEFKKLAFGLMPNTERIRIKERYYGPEEESIDNE